MAERADFYAPEELTVLRAKVFGKDLLASVRAGGQISLDLSMVQHMDTAGLQLLMEAHSAAAQAGGRLQLLHPAPIVSETFRFCGLGRLIDIPA